MKWFIGDKPHWFSFILLHCHDMSTVNSRHYSSVVISVSMSQMCLLQLVRYINYNMSSQFCHFHYTTPYVHPTVDCSY